MKDTKGSMSNCYEALPSGSVPTVTQLLYRLKSSKGLQPMWIAIPATRTPGDDAILAFDISVWPAWTRPTMLSMLIDMGGVLLESAQLPTTGVLVEKLHARPAKNPESDSPVMTAEPATDIDDPQSSPTLSSKPTGAEPNDS